MYIDPFLGMLFIFYCVVATFLIAILITSTEPDNILDNLVLVGVGLFFPITIPVALTISLTDAICLSAKNIRTSLKNKGVLKEFESFLDYRKGVAFFSNLNIEILSIYPSLLTREISVFVNISQIYVSHISNNSKLEPRLSLLKESGIIKDYKISSEELTIVTETNSFVVKHLRSSARASLIRVYNHDTPSKGVKPTQTEIPIFQARVTAFSSVDVPVLLSKKDAFSDGKPISDSK